MSSFARSRDEPPGATSAAWDGAAGGAQQRPRPVGVPLAHGGAAPRVVQLRTPVVGHRERDDRRRVQAAETFAPAVEGRRLHQLAEPPGAFAASGRRFGGHAVPLHAGVALVRSLDVDGRADRFRCGVRTRAGSSGRGGQPVQADAGAGALCHPGRQRGAGQRGQQLGGRRADVTAAVRQRLFQERLVARREALAQGVEEHQPVLGALGGPRRGEQVQARLRVAAAQRRQHRDPLREQALFPQRPDALRILGAGQRGAADAAEGVLPVVVEPRQPQGARPGQGEGGGPQIRAGAGGVEQRGQQRLGGAVAELACRGEPLGQQLGEIGRRAAPTAAGAAAVGEQQGEPAPGGGRQWGAGVGGGR